MHKDIMGVLKYILLHLLIVKTKRVKLIFMQKYLQVSPGNMTADVASLGLVGQWKWMLLMQRMTRRRMAVPV